MTPTLFAFMKTNWLGWFMSMFVCVCINMFLDIYIYIFASIYIFSDVNWPYCQGAWEARL